MRAFSARAYSALAFAAIVIFPLAVAGAQTTPATMPRTMSEELDRKIRVFGLADVLEYVPSGKGSVRIDALAWIGGDYNRVFLRIDGDQPFAGSGGETAVDVAYGRLVSPFWTALLGGRVEMRGLGSTRRSTRKLLALGFEGLSPYWFEMEPMLYVSSKGSVSGRFATSIDLYFTQRLILQPRVEANFAVQQVRELGIGSGVNDLELGGRLRYEFRREFAPYMGLAWFRKTGATAGLARKAGEPIRDAGLVFGIRIWR